LGFSLTRGGQKSAAIHQSNGTGFHAPGIQSKAGKKAAELKVGVHGRSTEQMVADGRKSAAINKANGTGAFYDPKVQSANSKITNSQRWQCSVTGHISSPGPLSRYQKARGIDTKLRVKLNQMVAVDVNTPSISD
jgi:hypothetical protein